MRRIGIVNQTDYICPYVDTTSTSGSCMQHSSGDIRGCLLQEKMFSAHLCMPPADATTRTVRSTLLSYSFLSCVSSLLYIYRSWLACRCHRFISNPERNFTPNVILRFIVLCGILVVRIGGV